MKRSPSSFGGLVLAGIVWLWLAPAILLVALFKFNRAKQLGTSLATFIREIAEA